jgi:uncharacterized protein DUF4154
MMYKRFLCLIILSGYLVSTGMQTTEQEANLKAAFIYNFTKYIDWDTNRTDSNFVIGIVGSSPIITPLNEIAKTNTVNNERIVIRVFSKPEEIEGCNILFIPANSPFSLQSILDRTERGELTISEKAGYAKQGTAFNLVIINNKLKFEANLKAIADAGLKAGSQLLKLAIIVDKM